MGVLFADEAQGKVAAFIGWPKAPPSYPDGAADSKWIHEQLVRTEEHWTAQRQNQQARVATTMTVAGVMLTLLAPLVFDDHPTRSLTEAHKSLAWACLLLSVSLIFGVLALFPWRAPTREWFIDPEYFKRLSVRDQLEPGVFTLVQKSFPKTGIKALWLRRIFIMIQLTLIGVAAGFLIASFAHAV
jgi:hypothetical protein